MLLTAFDVLARRQMTERAVGSMGIVIVAPSIKKLLRMGDVHKAVHVEALVTQATIKTQRTQ